jgi:hypothetical protein
MYTHGGGFRTQSILAAVSLSIACASQAASRPRPDVVNLNAPAGSRVDANASRGDFIRGESVRYARMADLLEARVPGLDVRPIGGGRFTLRVRGHTELANAEPVIIIDGMHYSRGGADMLAELAPREVRRIEVVKDAASIAGIVGVAPGGVVVVTTWRH